MENITRDYIEQLCDLEPCYFKTDREEQWFNVGLQYGLETADDDPVLSWISVEDSLPRQDEEVIVLCDKLNASPMYEIAFAHIVNKGLCKDFNGWNIPNVKYWYPMPVLQKQH